MKKRGLILVGAVLLLLLIAGCTCKHIWEDATCTKPKTCTKCGESEGEALGHSWTDATCTEAKTCVVCEETEGEPVGHVWKDAECDVPKVCTVCGETEGEVLGHEWENAVCIKPKTCKRCGETEGKPLGHQWDAATCTEPKTCRVCGETEGEALGHQVLQWETVKPATCIEEGEQTGVCDVCARNTTETIPITEHTAGQWVVTVEPTEDEPGEWTLYCAVCGEVMETQVYELSAEEIKQRYKDNCSSYSYETLARDPGGYKGTYGKYTGEVIQVMESSFLGVISYTLRINITKGKYGYSDTIYVTYMQSGDAPRILEDDIVTVWGMNNGSKTYQTVLGASVTIPWVEAEYIEIN